MPINFKTVCTCVNVHNANTYEILSDSYNSVEEKLDLVSYYIQYKQNEKPTCTNSLHLVSFICSFTSMAMKYFLFGRHICFQLHTMLMPHTYIHTYSQHLI